MNQPAILQNSRSRTAAALAVTLMLAGLGLSGCGVVNAVGKIKHDVESNKGTIDTFTNRISATEGTTFEATYVTTGGSPATIVYAVKPPKGVAFTLTPTGASSSNGVGRTDIVVNSSGEYYCTPPSSGAGWTCQKPESADAAVKNKILDFYTPSHWVTFLQDFSLAAGFAGDKITTSTLTVNGFSMKCVDFRASGVPGTSTVCTTSQGILGYVKVATDSTSFEIRAYSASPPASLFALPPGAKITTTKTGTT
jgi:hypothetical protein